MKTNLLFLFTATLLFAAPPAWAQVVTTTNASGPGSLRAVVAAAAPGATITFAAGLSGQTISLGSSEILLNKNVTIDASALPLGIQITQPPSPFARIIQVASNTTVVLKALTISGARFPYGGAILNDGGSLTINYCTLYDNLASEGGAIANRGALTMNYCTLYDNGAEQAGAIWNEAGSLTMNHCILYDNSAEFGGAILNNSGSLTMNQCTLARNGADGNSNASGGAIYGSSGSITINQSTITDNSARLQGGGVCNSSASMSLFNSIVAGNTDKDNNTDNIRGAYTAKGTNLVSGDPLLLPLGHYGGPTQTMPPRTNSPAVNAGADFINTGVLGAPVGITDIFPTDQRGRPRLFGAHVDIGAVELQSPMVVTNLADSGPGSLRQAASNVEPAESITFAAGLSGQSIQLGSTLLLDQNLTIDASGLPAGIKLLGAGRVLEVAAGQTVVLRALEVRNGFHNDAGAGIYNAGTLTLDRCTLANNGSNADGSYRPVEGGAIYNTSALTLNQCTVAGNVARSGAAIYNAGTLTLNQSTISGNEGNSGAGGVRNVGSLTLNNALLAGNFTSSIFDPNLSGGGPLTLLGNNLTTGDPQLAGLGNYGGPTQTMPPLPGSPALDAGADSATNSFTTDQRGGWRRSGAGVDIGAVEVVAASAVPAVLTGLKQLTNGARQFTFTNLVAAGFTVYASTNLVAPLNAWLNLGPAVETPLGSGQYQFSDLAATNHPQRFYRVQSP